MQAAKLLKINWPQLKRAHQIIGEHLFRDGGDPIFDSSSKKCKIHLPSEISRIIAFRNSCSSMLSQHSCEFGTVYIHAMMDPSKCKNNQSVFVTIKADCELLSSRHKPLPQMKRECITELGKTLMHAISKYNTSYPDESIQVLLLGELPKISLLDKVLPKTAFECLMEGLTCGGSLNAPRVEIASEIQNQIAGKMR